ncbi:heavy metal-(Cd/Co/Hg/Pb/Zn)-translocating P-type ATPase [Soonwooa buanensis]|uniref:P-type Zn(2+) transporter n=1 Tax=Soonwooa buanensis TaxID=619805 RepID=A0A1T5CXQ9_9FLAO|nr:heavy metal translocating P-type ATPase [Soonwooa buanensis]SKB64137.1 heavy metal-(Cd/Co/Hg/Pb/Zn)-translocating P-type ATPase [Soonwooa buanensis]
MKNINKFITVLSIAVVALLLEFILKEPYYAKILITVTGIIMSVILLKGMIDVLRSGNFGVDILAISAIAATLAVGNYWASLIILIMITGGDSLEDYAQKKARKDLKSLLDNTPKIAHKKIGNDLNDVPVDDIQIGDIIIVKPKETVPVDGILLSDEVLLDESSLTGESKPVSKLRGNSLWSGSLNGSGAITIQVSKLAKDSQYQQLVQLVHNSEKEPAHFVRMADRYALPFTIVAFLIAGISYLITRDPNRIAEVLVVASPCPLILAAPIALISGMSRSSRNGVVIKSGTVIEKLDKMKAIAFDKTGTLTKGDLAMDEILPENLFSKEELIDLVASVEQQSSHVLAISIMKNIGSKNIPLATDLKEIEGKGVEGKVNGKLIKVGKLNFVTNQSIQIKSEKTSLFVSVNDQYVGEITFSDEVRPEARQTIAQLLKMGIRKIMMISGDKQSISETIAKEIGISEVYAGCLPEDKLKILKSVSDDFRPIVMVGDGVNDAPSLTVADVGIAMGAKGSSAASDSADVVILKDNLEKVSDTVMISRETMKIARQSVFIGIAVCTVLMLIAAFGLLPALLGAGLQEVVDVISITSALRALKDRT